MKRRGERRHLQPRRDAAEEGAQGGLGRGECDEHLEQRALRFADEVRVRRLALRPCTGRGQRVRAAVSARTLPGRSATAPRRTGQARPQKAPQSGTRLLAIFWRSSGDLVPTQTGLVLAPHLPATMSPSDAVTDCNRRCPTCCEPISARRSASSRSAAKDASAASASRCGLDSTSAKYDSAVRSCGKGRQAGRAGRREKGCELQDVGRPVTAEHGCTRLGRDMRGCRVTAWEACLTSVKGYSI